MWLGQLLDPEVLINFGCIINKSSLYQDIIIPVWGYIFIILTLLGVGGPGIYLEIWSVILNIFLKRYLKNKFWIQKYFIAIIAFIFIIYLCISTLVFMIFSIKVFYFLVDFLPILGLIGLGYINPDLVKNDLVNRINIFSLMLVLGFILGLSFFLVIYIYEPQFLKIYFSLLISIRSSFVGLILVYILISLFYMPWNKNNLIKFGVLFFGLWLLGTLFNTTGKLSSYIFLYMKNEDPFQFSLYTDLEKVDLDKLYGEIFPGRDLSSEDLRVMNVNNILKLPKFSIFDYIQFSWLKYLNVRQDLVQLNYLQGKLPKIRLFYGFIALDLNKHIVKSFLLSDSGLFDFSPSIWSRSPELIKDYYKYVKVSAIYVKDGFWCWDLKLNHSYTLVRYDPYLQEGFKVQNSNGRREVYSFKLIFPYKESASNIINKLPKIDYNILDSSFDNRYLLDIPRSYYYKNKAKSSIYVSIPSSVDLENLKPFVTERLILRRLRISDAEAYSLVYSDSETVWNSSLRLRGPDVNMAKRWIEGDINHYQKKGRGVMLGVFLKNMQGGEGELIGKLGTYIAEWPSVNYMFKKQYWGKGYGSECLEAWLNYYFSLPSKEVKMELPVEFIENKYKNKATKLLKVDTFVFNERSGNLLRKMGFKLWYLNQIVCAIHDNIFSRLVQKWGFDLMKPRGFKLYLGLSTSWEHHNKYIRDFNIYLYWLLLSKHPWFIANWYRNPDMYRFISMHIYEWILSEDDFNKRYKAKNLRYV